MASLSNTRYTIRRAAKISTGNYENTDVSVEISEDYNDAIGLTEPEHIASIIARADTALKRKIDEIELGKRESQSKAKRFGV